jgi:hypothetical protein
VSLRFEVDSGGFDCLVVVHSICDSEVFLLYHDGMQLLTRLVFERGSADAAGKVAEIMGAGKVAEIMGADLVHQVFSSLLN